MWHLIQDFFDQSLVMKLFIAWGWLSIVIMAASLVSAGISAYTSA